MAKFYLDKRYYADKPAKWVSFESTPNLEETKEGHLREMRAMHIQPV